MLSPEVLDVPVPVALVPGLKLPQRFGVARREYPYLPEPPTLIHELNRLNAGAGVPVSVDDDKPWIRLYVERACIAVRVSGHGDAFSIEFIEPMRLSNHGRLARSSLRLRTAAWSYFPELRLVPGYPAPDREVREAWRRLQTPQSKASAAPARHGAFCDALDKVIEAARQIEIERDPADRMLPYYEVLAVARPRGSSAGIYQFRMSRPGPVQTGSTVHIRDERDIRGRVATVDGELLTVAFEGAVDRRRIPDSGFLVATLNETVQRVQAGAVARLRARTTVNSDLLPLLVDRKFATYQAPAADPAEPLDPDQTEAFRRALVVPDLLCVLGPPGTGKTRTIVETARTASGRGERVLIASQTNTAVDNVIERLPDSMIAIRVGNEERIAAAVRHKTVGAIAADLQQRILARTEPVVQGLAPFAGRPSRAGAWMEGLEKALAGVASANAEHERALAERSAAEALVATRFADPMAEAEQASSSDSDAAASAEAEVQRLVARLARLERLDGPFGFLHRWRAGRCRERLARASPLAAQLRANAEQSRQKYDTLLAELAHEIAGDPGVRRAADRVAGATADAERKIRQGADAAGAIASLMAAAGLPSAPRADEAGLRAFATWCRAWEPFLRERHQILLDWRATLSRPSEQLHPELIRYADVIGTTCIGVGVQRNLLTDLEFDLAVIDEAGQIPFASTLVPMTRARRLVLVGDHHQLPPFVDDDVRQWLQRHEPKPQGAEVETLLRLLTRSAFEMLLESAPQANRILLSRQRRMPAVLADFVSVAFYDGRLITETPPRPPSAIFRSPLAFVDTSALPEDKRAERSKKRTETWQTAGSDNPAEAGIVLSLAQVYESEGRDWVVIAPYRAQAQLLDLWLREALGARAIRDRIGTVDAFQGQERDIVMYSFTRSNRRGAVGFLKETRRLNVAITRAREQLVLIGDRTTLTRADDQPFRRLAQGLFEYADRVGDVVPAPGLRDRMMP